MSDNEFDYFSLLHSNDSILNVREINESDKSIYLVTKYADSLSRVGNNNVLKELSIVESKVEKSKDKKILADYYHVFGKVLIKNKQFYQGIEKLKNSLQIKESIYGTNDIKLAKTINYLGIGYFMLKKREIAMDYYTKSQLILSSNNYVGRDLYDAYLNMGIIKASQGSYEEGFEFFSKASDNIGVDGAPDSLTLSGFYKNFGLLSTLMGKTKLANQYFKKSESYLIASVNADDIKFATLYLNMGVNSFRDFNYDMSILYFEKAIEIFERNGGGQNGLLKTINNLSGAYREIGNYDLAIEYSKRALLMNPDADLKLMIYQSLAKTYLETGNIKELNDIFDKALKLVEQPGINPKRKFDIYFVFANAMMKLNNYDLAFKYYRLSLDIEGDVNGFSTPVYADVLSKIGNYYLHENDVNMALVYFNRSIENWQNNFKLDKKGNIIYNDFYDIRFLDAYSGKASALIEKYKLFNNIKDLIDSYNIHEWLLKQMEIKSRGLVKDNQTILRELIYPLYNSAINLCFNLYENTGDKFYQEKAFEYAERSKSAVLLSSMQSSNALSTSDVDSKTLALDESLNEEINSIKRQLFEENQKISKSPKRMHFFNTRLLKLLRTHDSLVNQLEENNPKYYSLKYDVSAITLDKINWKLKSDEAIVEYQIVDSNLYTFVVKNKRLFTVKTVIDSNFYKALDYLIKIKNRKVESVNRESFKRFVENSEFLYSKLISPVYEYIKNKRLVIIPSGHLGYLPFEILVKPDSEYCDLKYNSLSYLMHEFPISYSYSTTLKFSEFFNNSSYLNNPDILYMAPDYSVNNNEDSNFKYKDLPFARKEVKSLQSVFGGKQLLGERATKEQFLKRASSYDLIHLAMHTSINDTLPAMSKLVFSPNTGSEDEIFLTTADIYQMDLRASLVTLSACNTGSGIYQRGEGIMSLARGFVYAGVPSVVMTLWEVQDKSGLQIMEKFYKNLSDGMTKDVALQKAKLEVLASSNMAKAYPFYWSAYIVTGDTAELDIGNRRSSLWIMLLFIIPSVALFFLYKRIVSRVEY